MPSTSQSQQRLMGQAYAVRQFMDSGGKKGLNPNEIDSKYREKIEDLAKNMSKEDLKDFATKLEENSPTATLGSVNGMGSVSLPDTDGKTGSGDIPFSLNKKKKVFKQFKEFTVALQEASKYGSNNPILPIGSVNMTNGDNKVFNVFDTWKNNSIIEIWRRNDTDKFILLFTASKAPHAKPGDLQSFENDQTRKFMFSAKFIEALPFNKPEQIVTKYGKILNGYTYK